MQILNYLCKFREELEHSKYLTILHSSPRLIILYPFKKNAISPARVSLEIMVHNEKKKNTFCYTYKNLFFCIFCWYGLTNDTRWLQAPLKFMGYIKLFLDITLYQLDTNKLSSNVRGFFFDKISRHSPGFNVGDPVSGFIRWLG